MHPEDETILQLASTVVDALGDQVEVHVDLARAEFARDARALRARSIPPGGSRFGPGVNRSDASPLTLRCRPAASPAPSCRPQV